jgi:hypothetical protein
MTREHAKEMLPIITAFAKGEAVETLNWKGEWILATDLTFEGEIDKYRIPLKPRKVFINEYPEYPFYQTKEDADNDALSDRIACHCIELPPLF